MRQVSALRSGCAIYGLTHTMSNVMREVYGCARELAKEAGQLSAVSIELCGKEHLFGHEADKGCGILCCAKGKAWVLSAIAKTYTRIEQYTRTAVKRRSPEEEAANRERTNKRLATLASKRRALTDVPGADTVHS